MSDLIKREDAIKELSKVFANCEPCDKEEASDIAVTTIKELPSADRPQGHWEIYTVSPFDGEDCRCSECGAAGCAPYWDYCPHCGAKMEGADE